MALKGNITVIQGLPEVAKELRYIGNNINQLTKLCHEGKIQVLEMAEIKKQMEEIWQSLNLQIQKAG